jgi:hypothetical protein
VKRLVIPLVRIINFTLTPLASNTNFALRFLLEFLLRLTGWANNHTYVVDGWVFRIRDVDFLLFFWWLVISRRNVSWI